VEKDYYIWQQLNIKSLTDHLAVEEIAVFFKGSVTVKQYTPKKHKQFGINLYKLRDSKVYTYDITVHLGNTGNAQIPPSQLQTQL